MTEISKLIKSAVESYQSGDFGYTESICKKVLKKQPANPEALHLIGILKYQSGDYDSATQYFRKALQIIPANAYLHYNLGNALKDQGQVDKAILCYQEALELNPNFFEAYHNLGIVFQDKKRFDEAIICYQKALAINPLYPDTYYNLGTIFQDKGQHNEAIIFYEKALQLNPNFVDVHYNIGNSFSEKRQFDKAIRHYEKALQLNPDLVDANYNLGIVFEEKGQLSEAIKFYQRALQLSPNFANAYNNLGNIMQKQDKFEMAIEYYRIALTLNPAFVEAYVNLGNMLRDYRKVGDVEKYYRHALEIKPDCSSCYSGLFFLMLYDTRYTARDIFAEHLRFTKRCAELSSGILLPHVNERTPRRRLRVGYVSPDFRRHSVAYFIEPVVAAHDREVVEVFCYSDVVNQDGITARIRGQADHWRDITGMSDEEASEVIRGDGIDILVDLAGHTSNNRLLMFARKPAPVQVSWIGYPATTGLSTVDYKIVDGYTDPPGMTEEFYTEELIRLPESFLCYQPDRESPDVGELPALTTGHVTFGSFNTFPKVTSEVIALWGEMMKEIPGSRLIMKAKSFSDGSTREYVMGMFRERGVDAERIEILPWEASTGGHLGTYNRVDIALDTFPYNGTTTTCEAMWMGVPVITLAGKTHASRVGVSLLSNIGLRELIAGRNDEYLRIAVNLSADLKKLQLLRKSLRGMMARSPLNDVKRFITNIENCYRAIWKNWCRASYEKT